MGNDPEARKHIELVLSGTLKASALVPGADYTALQANPSRSTQPERRVRPYRLMNLLAAH